MRRAKRLALAIEDVVAASSGGSGNLLRALGPNLSRDQRQANAYFCVVICALVLDPEEPDWLGGMTDLAACPWGTKLAAERHYERRADVCSRWGQEALRLLSEACGVLQWPMESEASPIENDAKSNEHPTIRLWGALHHLRNVCFSAHSLFGNLEERRARRRDANTRHAQFVCDFVNQRGKQQALEGVPPRESLAEALQSLEAIGEHRDPEDPQDLVGMLTTALERADDACDVVTCTLRDGGGKVLDSVLTPETGARSAQVGVLVQQIRDTFLDLRAGLAIRGSLLADHVERLGQHTDALEGTIHELTAVMEQHGLEADQGERLAREANAADGAPSIPEPPALTEDHERVLRYLKKIEGRCRPATWIADNGPIRNRETLGQLLKDLAVMGFAHQPHGRKKGWAIGDLGVKHLDKLDGKS
jgi:hypothetical protein